MNFLFRAQAFIRFLFKSKGLHRVHSPFVFRMYEDLIRSNDRFYAFEELEEIRAQLLSDKRIIERTGIGALKKPKPHALGEIARRTLATNHWCQIYFKLVAHYKPETILEIGTGVGLCTLYLAEAHQGARVVTLEGDPAIAAVAREQFEKRKHHKIELVEGLFDDTLPSVLKRNPSPQFIIVDGNHTYSATMRYFEWLLPHVNDDTFLIFDDIHWSAEMERAWKEIKQHPDVRQTIDFFRVGMVFFRKGQVKQHFILRSSFTGI
jgi:predicted O-methyltransferase YrrM